MFQVIVTTINSSIADFLMSQKIRLLGDLATWCEEPTHWTRPWCWETLRAGREGDNRGWDCWMVSLTQWMWVWANSRRQWRTGKAGILQFMGSQRVRHNLVSEQKKTKQRNWHRFRSSIISGLDCVGFLLSSPDYRMAVTFLGIYILDEKEKMVGHP